MSCVLRAGRVGHPILRVILIFVLVLLAVVLLVHLIGMIHGDGMGLLATCLFLLAAALALAVPEIRRPLVPADAVRPPDAGPRAAVPACRPPPREGTLRGVVLIC